MPKVCETVCIKLMGEGAGEKEVYSKYLKLKRLLFQGRLGWLALIRCDRPSFLCLPIDDPSGRSHHNNSSRWNYM